MAHGIPCHICQRVQTLAWANQLPSTADGQSHKYQSSPQKNDMQVHSEKMALGICLRRQLAKPITFLHSLTHGTSYPVCHRVQKLAFQPAVMDVRI